MFSDVSFDGRSIKYGFGELDTLVPAYAATIHKSQGSEYPAVIIPVLTQHYAMLQRNLLYTGVTRGRRKNMDRPKNWEAHGKQLGANSCSFMPAGF